MITRSADQAKDTSALFKRAEITHDFQAAQAQIINAQEQQRVAKTLETEKQDLRPDESNEEGGDGKGGGGGKRKRKNNPGDLNDPENLTVPPSTNRIDIRA
jgi:hypothetical protein